MKLPFIGRKPEKALSSVDDRGWVRIFDWTPNAWQTHDPYDNSESSILANPTVFSCITLVQGDIGKLPFVVEQKDGQVWQRVEHDILKLLRRPNLYQNQIQFLKHWIWSKLLFGNTYVFKVRQGRDVVGLYILDPLKVTPLISDMGEVFYQVTDDKLSKMQGTALVPSSEIIHDRDNCLYHPLVGLSPLFAATNAARISNAIIKDSKAFFTQGAKPSGILTAPGNIADGTAQRLKEYWERNFSGDKAGKVAVVGDGLTYTAVRMNSVDAQLIEQLGWSDEKICSVFHIPAYMVGVGQMPSYNNIEALTIQYFTQCLQELIQGLEECLNQGLNIQPRFRIQLDLDGLFRMDQTSQAEVVTKLVGGKVMRPDEGRAKFNLPPTGGGDTLWGQKQDYPLGVLAERHAQGLEEQPQEPTEEQIDEQARYLAYSLTKELSLEYARA